jgi:hypothetical protein
LYVRSYASRGYADAIATMVKNLTAGP